MINTKQKPRPESIKNEKARDSKELDKITFTAGIKKFEVKSGDGLPACSLVLDGITGLGKRMQDVVDKMNGAVLVTLVPAQSGLKFGEKPEGAKIESPVLSESQPKKDK